LFGCGAVWSEGQLNVEPNGLKYFSEKIFAKIFAFSKET